MIAPYSRPYTGLHPAKENLFGNQKACTVEAALVKSGSEEAWPGSSSNDLVFRCLCLQIKVE